MGDSVSHQRRVNVLAETLIAKAANMIFALDMSEEAKASTEVTTGNATAENVSALGAAVAAIQQLMKGAQTTPPETGKVG